MLEIAQKTFNNKDLDEKKEKKLARIMVATLREGEDRDWKYLRRLNGARLAKDQCAYCKEKGQWKNECLQHRQEKGAEVLNLTGTD